MNKFEKYWEDANKIILEIPYTDESHHKVIRIQEKAERELEAMERKSPLKIMEVPAIA